MYTHKHTHTQQGQSEKFYHKEQQNSYITRTHTHTDIRTRSHTHTRSMGVISVNLSVGLSSSAFEIEIASATEEKEKEEEEGGEEEKHLLALSNKLNWNDSKNNFHIKFYNLPMFTCQSNIKRDRKRKRESERVTQQTWRPLVSAKNNGTKWISSNDTHSAQNLKA